MKLLTLIPARGGSKRIPNKNIRVLGNKPLIVWSIDAARAAPELADVLVSTDSPLIAQIAMAAGAIVPWLRPAALASDTASSSDVLKHALEWYELEFGPVDGVVLLQPTCPFRRLTSLRGALKRFLDQPGGENRSTVVSVSPSSVPPEWCFRMDTSIGELEPVLGWTDIGKRSQDLQPAVQINGSIYIATSSTIRAGRPLVGPGSRAFLMPGSEECVDIDTESDWLLAESFLSR